MVPVEPSTVPVGQFRERPGLIDLGSGTPHPTALPVRAWAEASRRAMDTYGGAALGYGHEPGPWPLVAWLCERLGQVDGRAPQPAEVFVTAGASQALELVASLLVRPGDTVLVDAPTYHYALGVLRDHAGAVVAAPTDDDGIDPDATARLIESLAREGRRVPMLYLVPTFNNPSGACLPAARRVALADLARRTGTAIVDDDTYRELAYDGPAPPSIFALAEGGPAGGDGAVVRLGSFSKTVAPGIRVGWLTAPAPLVERLAARGWVRSGGGVNHAAALTMAAFAGAGAFERHVDRIRAFYRARRDHLVAAVRRYLPVAEFTPPAGGWFLWLRLPAGTDTAALLPHAEAHGVSYVPGNRFFVNGGGERYLRLAYSMLDTDALTEGTRRLATAVESLR